MRGVPVATLAVMLAGLSFAGCTSSAQIPDPARWDDAASRPAAGATQGGLYSGRRAAYAGLRDLYVLDGGEVKLFKNHLYSPDGVITYGAGDGQADFLDAVGNLYVADDLTPMVSEFSPGATTPSFSYNAGMIDPSNVAVDRKGDVFETDFAYGGSGFVNEYAKNVNSVLRHCSLGNPAGGIALDSANDVFVDYRHLAKSLIVEYKGGLAGCHATKLGVRFSFAGGMAVDRNGNLIVCDLVTPAVDVIAPPYNAVTRVLGSGYVYPYNVAINRENTKVFVVDADGGDENALDVIEYSSGAVVKRLGSKQGLFDPVGVTDGPNAVY